MPALELGLMMKGGCGMTLRPLLATWSHRPACSCSRTSLGCSLQMAGVLWPVSFMAWPRSATWDRGGLYALPTWEPLTSASGFSSSPGPLIPTPNASDGSVGQSPTLRRQAGHQIRLIDWAIGWHEATTNGDHMRPQSPGGNASPDRQLPLPWSQDDADSPASALASLSG